MCFKILAVLGLVGFLPLANCEKTSMNDTVTSECVPPFQAVNNGCYYFSDIAMEFSEASDYCDSLTLGHTYKISLAMLDYSRDEDQALLDAVASQPDVPYWVGAKTENGQTWSWVDGRDVYSNAPFWAYGEPSEGNCAIVQRNTPPLNNINRAYMYTEDCSASLNFICQTDPCPANFIRIGNICYLQSWVNGVPDLHWEEARAYCKSLSVPTGYHADLAVLGLQDQSDYSLMLELVENDTIYQHWIGAYQDTDYHYQWVDGRELPNESIYWHSVCPRGYDGVSINYYSSDNRALLADYNVDVSSSFICQMFKDV